MRRCVDGARRRRTTSEGGALRPRPARQRSTAAHVRQQGHADQRLAARHAHGTPTDGAVADSAKAEFMWLTPKVPL